ncbi:GNAT family N-acetyltransferase [Celerinatantimonas yamalensis]|uniref:GNAT family N-acetyltransferase n=1 Tax=Celerinatantimonas yamalensis TaxID=559956 RepID=A0ABW9G783_9GAMM
MHHARFRNQAIVACQCVTIVWLLPKSKGKEYAKEASIAAVAYAYNELGWCKVETYMHDSNDSARVLVKRLGGIQSGRHKFHDGLSRNIYIIPKPA